MGRRKCWIIRSCMRPDLELARSCPPLLRASIHAVPPNNCRGADAPTLDVMSAEVVALVSNAAQLSSLSSLSSLCGATINACLLRLCRPHPEVQQVAHKQSSHHSCCNAYRPPFEQPSLVTVVATQQQNGRASSVATALPMVHAFHMHQPAQSSRRRLRA